jgi:hypothetical protein
LTPGSGDLAIDDNDVTHMGDVAALRETVGKAFAARKAPGILLIRAAINLR